MSKNEVSHNKTAYLCQEYISADYPILWIPVCTGMTNQSFYQNDSKREYNVKKIGGFVPCLKQAKILLR